VRKIGVDFDGTLLDSRPRHKIALLKASEILNISLPSGLANNYVNEKSYGFSGLQVLKKYNVDKAKELHGLWVNIIEDESMLAQDKLYPGVKEYLEAIYKENEIYLVTARTYKSRTLDQLRILGIDKLFSDIFVIEIKQNVKIGELKSKATKKYNIEYVIGDTETDLEWANLSKAEFRPVICGFRNKSYWESKGIPVYADFMDAMEF
jgi:phosphoglycolate phosphatase-like HAD superfamily hydrolase